MTDPDTLRDAWLSECWAPVREYRSTDADRAAAEARRDLMARALDMHDSDESLSA